MLRPVFLFGPTGVGKTSFLLSLDPSRFEIVNCDSIQVYKGLDIGSAKAPAEERERVVHHLIDIEDPRNQFTVARFISLADKAVEDITRRGKTPVLSGGTAYYFKHFCYGLSKAPESDPDVRNRVDRMIKEKGKKYAYEMLNEVDPVSGKRININDVYRISRALEVYLSSGKPLSSFKIPDTPRNGMKPLVIGLYRDTGDLNARIGQRVDMMFSMGLLDEIRGLIAQGANDTWPGMQGIGYREFFDALREGECSLSTIRDDIARNSRVYAKHQMTFFRSFKDVHWVHADDTETLKSLLSDLSDR